MNRHIPGLHQATQNGNENLEVIFLVQVERAFYRWHPCSSRWCGGSPTGTTSWPISTRSAVTMALVA